MPGEHILFGDGALEAAVRLELGIPVGPIGCDRMLEITGLDLVRHPEVSDLTALRHCSNLAILSLEGTQVGDLSPLTRLGRLETLSVNCTRVSDLSTLVDMRNLRRLFVGGTRVTDLSPLATMTGLKYISLAYSPISDIQALIDLRRGGGLKKGEVNLWGAPLSWRARYVQVPILAALDVEVQV